MVATILQPDHRRQVNKITRPVQKYTSWKPSPRRSRSRSQRTSLSHSSTISKEHRRRRHAPGILRRHGPRTMEELITLPASRARPRTSSSPALRHQRGHCCRYPRERLSFFSPHEHTDPSRSRRTLWPWSRKGMGNFSHLLIYHGRPSARPEAAAR